MHLKDLDALNTKSVFHYFPWSPEQSIKVLSCKHLYISNCFKDTESLEKTECESFTSHTLTVPSTEKMLNTYILKERVNAYHYTDTSHPNLCFLPVKVSTNEAESSDRDMVLTAQTLDSDFLTSISCPSLTGYIIFGRLLGFPKLNVHIGKMGRFSLTSLDFCKD